MEHKLSNVLIKASGRCNHNDLQYLGRTGHGQSMYLCKKCLHKITK